MKKILSIISFILLSACSYDESMETYDVTVRLIYPENSIEPYAGARVELKNATASIFADSTDAQGIARFTVPSGIYEASSSTQLITYDWRYNFNGVKSMIIISPDSTNDIELPLTMSRKRIVH